MAVWRNCLPKCILRMQEYPLSAIHTCVNTANAHALVTILLTIRKTLPPDVNSIVLPNGGLFVYLLPDGIKCGCSGFHSILEISILSVAPAAFEVDGFFNTATLLH